MHVRRSRRACQLAAHGQTATTVVPADNAAKGVPVAAPQTAALKGIPVATTEIAAVRLIVQHAWAAIVFQLASAAKSA